ncbi:MAG: hypothetical protein PWQ96_260 [Clostridia bacterium]|jgi:uncharacterized membrane protein YraQ (UPF0718 family)|nr:hypothetical protein [Clostridia bacterium]
MYIAAVILGIMAYLRGGMENLLQGLTAGFKTVFISFPLIILAMIVAGLLQVLVSQDFIKRWLGKEAGLKGIFLAGLAGALIPGGPYVYYPIAVSFFAAGAEIGTVMAFVTAKNLWSLSRIPWEMALLGPEITVVRYIVTFIFPIVIGLIANILYSKYSSSLRKWIVAAQKARGESK